MSTSLTTLSARGAALARTPPFPPYLDEHFARTGNAYDARHRPGGYIGLAVAENKQLSESLIERLGTIGGVPAQVLGYGDMTGALSFRRGLASFLEHFVLGRSVEPDHIAVMAGAGSVLEILFHNLCDPGDCVLVPTPSYAGFWADLETRDQVRIVPVDTSLEDDFRLTVTDLDRAVANAPGRVRALLFTSPNNPLGTVYDADTIEAILDWGERHRIHLVFDEIYALSVHGARPFVSCAQLRPTLGEHLHVVWAFSKDFGMSGLRCGVLVSENEQLLLASKGLAYWATCSRHTQFLLESLIADTSWVERYTTQMQAGLRDTYQRLTAALDTHRIPFVPAEAGFFLLLDLRCFLDRPTWDAEERLWRRLLEDAQVNLTPGAACRNAEPGLFRLCFAAVSTEAAVTAAERIARVLHR